MEWIGLGHSEIARTLIGTSFAWMDIIAYTTGALAIRWFENRNTGILILKDKKS